MSELEIDFVDNNLLNTPGNHSGDAQQARLLLLRYAKRGKLPFEPQTAAKE